MGRLISEKEKFTLGSAESAMNYVDGNLTRWLETALRLNKFIRMNRELDPEGSIILEGPIKLLMVVNKYVDALAMDAATKIDDGHFK